MKPSTTPSHCTLNRVRVGGELNIRVTFMKHEP